MCNAGQLRDLIDVAMLDAWSITETSCTVGHLGMIRDVHDAGWLSHASSPRIAGQVTEEPCSCLVAEALEMCMILAGCFMHCCRVC